MQSVQNGNGGTTIVERVETRPDGSVMFYLSGGGFRIGTAQIGGIIAAARAQACQCLAGGKKEAIDGGVCSHGVDRLNAISRGLGFNDANFGSFRLERACGDTGVDGTVGVNRQSGKGGLDAIRSGVCDSEDSDRNCGYAASGVAGLHRLEAESNVAAERQAKNSQVCQHGLPLDEKGFASCDLCQFLNGEFIKKKTLENREKRHASRDKKKARKASGYVRGRGVHSFSWRSDIDKEEEDQRATKFGTGGYFSLLAEEKRVSLRESRARMFEAENLLKAARAKRQLEQVESGVVSPIQQAKELKAVQQLEVLKAKDLELEKKKINTRMLRDAECDKVKIEQSFAKLAVTGNVPHVGGTVKTVVSGATGSLSSGTISPNSSVSMKEIHDMMEELASLRRSHEEHQEFARHVKTLHPLIYDTLAPKEREVGKSFPPETEYEPTEGGGYPEHAWELEENLGMFDLEPDNKFRRRPDPDDTSGLIEYHKRRFHQFGIPVPYKSELSFIADNHLGR